MGRRSVAISDTLNFLILSNLLEGSDFPSTTSPWRAAPPLPEDYAMRGLLWADNYFPENWVSTQ